jgi:hypothetical protein
MSTFLDPPQPSSETDPLSSEYPQGEYRAKSHANSHAQAVPPSDGECWNLDQSDHPFPYKGEHSGSFPCEGKHSDSFPYEGKLVQPSLPDSFPEAVGRAVIDLLDIMAAQ